MRGCAGCGHRRGYYLYEVNMIKGMTGFGAAGLSAGEIKGTVEIKSVNHRYADISYYLPPGFAAIENRIRRTLGQQVARGRITVVIKIFKKQAPSVSLNKTVVASYLKNARSLKRQFGLSGEIGLSDIITLPGVVETREAELSPDALWPAIAKSLGQALANMMVMRKREGKSLCADVTAMLSRMSLEIKKIQARAKKIVRAQKRALTDEEFVSFQKGCDINEELTRLRHHVEECRKLLKADIAVGKQMDFIAQEMQRETNTIGSKLQDAVVSNAVITLKSKIENIREQSQNIE